MTHLADGSGCWIVMRWRKGSAAGSGGVLPGLAEGSVVAIDGQAGYKHRVTVINGGDEQAHEAMPCVHNVASRLKRWRLGTLQGGVQHHHLDDYLDEFTFRFNRRRSNARGLLFYRLAQQAVAVGSSPYSSIIHGKSP
jgi:carotenoid cleavage dioxygenase-like enzyme